MSRYLIHACPNRMWYVNEFLVPSMKAQGIKSEEIIIYNDEQKLGNLEAYLDSAKLVMNEPGSTWHLQDDILISSNFRQITDYYDVFQIVCGFCNTYSISSPGFGPAVKMWYSFPCMLIANSILKDFTEWMRTPEVQNNFKPYIDAKKFDDSFFRYFLIKEKPNTVIFNLAPNIVENVDYLLGGSLANTGRDVNMDINSRCFEEPELVELLKLELAQRQ